MSKPPAKTAAAKKPAGTKTPGKKLVVKPVAKSAAKPAPKPAAKAAAKPAAKPAPNAVQKAASKPVSHKPAAELAPVAAVPKAAARSEPKTTHAPLPKTELKSPSKSAQKASATKAPPPPLPNPSNRFTDRFAPASPAKKAEHLPMEPAKPLAKVDPKVANAWKSKSGRELSEAELLAMPEAEYMNDKQLDFFRARLEQQKDDLHSNAGETTEHLREDTTIVPDPADRATIEEEHALELRTRDRERKLLKKVAQSLTRLETGEYGYCDETGEPIGLARLMARPTASLSLEAQQRREMKQKMFGN